MTIPHKLISFMLSLSFFLCYSSYSQAQEPQSQNPQVKKKITIAVGEWPPYISQEKNHNGVISHLITDIFFDIGIEATLQFLPWSRAYNDTMNGLHSASAIWMDKKERKVDFIYSNPVLIEQFVFFHHKDLPFDWNSLDDLKGFNMGGVYASSYGPAFDQALSAGKVTLERVKHPQQNFKKLLTKRIELFPFEINVGHSVLKNNFSEEQQLKITHNPKPLLNNSSFLLFPKSLKSSAELVVQFNQQLQKIRDNGQYDAYFEKLKQGYYDQELKPYINR